MKVRVRYFASVREALGSGETVEVEPGTRLGGAARRADRRGEPHAQALARGRAVRIALNQSLSDESALLPDGAEVAFFPPVTGG